MINLALFLIITLIAIILITKIYQFVGIKGIRYERYFDRTECHEGETVLLIEKVQNRKWLPIFWLRLESQIHANLKFPRQVDLQISSGEMFQNHRSLFSFMPYSQVIRRHQVLCSRRGCYRLNTAYMTYGDPFGYYKKSKPVELDLELLVFPKPLSQKELVLPSHSWQGDLSVKRWIVEDPFLIKGVRQYQNGDSLGKINWKATARSGELQVHQKDFTADHHLMIVINFDTDENMWNAIEDPEPIEQSIRYGISIAQMAIANGMNVGLLTNGRNIDAPKDQISRMKAGSGKGQLRHLNIALAQLVMHRSVPFEALMRSEIKKATRDIDYLVLTPYVSKRLTQLLGKLEKNGNEVKLVPITQRSNPAKGSDAVG